MGRTSEMPPISIPNVSTNASKQNATYPGCSASKLRRNRASARSVSSTSADPIGNPVNSSFLRATNPPRTEIEAARSSPRSASSRRLCRFSGADTGYHSPAPGVIEKQVAAIESEPEARGWNGPRHFTSARAYRVNGGSPASRTATTTCAFFTLGPKRTRAVGPFASIDTGPSCVG